MNDEKILDLAKKLKALAEQGVGGEKENATAILKSLMEKHGITLDSITEDVKKRRWFIVKTTQLKLIKQVVGSVIGGDFSYYVKQNIKTDIAFNLTDAEFIEIEAKFGFYWKKYEEDLRLFYSAFIQTNGLYAKPSKDDDKSYTRKAITEEDLRILEMARGLKKHEFQKRLTD